MNIDDLRKQEEVLWEELDNAKTEQLKENIRFEIAKVQNKIIMSWREDYAKQNKISISNSPE